jgi:heme exporter protein D
MYFDTVQAALSMDGHGSFVWVAYLVTLLIISAILLLPTLRRRRLLRRVATELARQESGYAAQGGGR